MRDAEKRDGAYTPDELAHMLKNAYNYEAREKHQKDHLETSYAGTVQRGNKLLDVYVDTENNAWYITHFIVGGRVVSEFEAIFGHPESKRHRRYAAG